MSGFQDWSEVSWDKTGHRASGVSKKQELQKAARKGQLQADKKYNAGTNSQNGSEVNMARLEESEEFAVQKISLELKKMLQQERQKAGMTQKELATACNAKATVIQEYEAGKGVPNGVMIKKIERAIKQKNPEFVIGTFTKAQKKAAEGQKAKQAKLAAAASGARKPAARAQPGPAARSRRF